MPTLLYLYQLHGDVLESREAARNNNNPTIIALRLRGGDGDGSGGGDEAFFGIRRVKE